MKRVGSTPTVSPRLHPVDERWALAACLDEDPELHHPAGYTGHRAHAQIEAARAVCARCPLTGVDGPCLTQALADERGAPIDRRHGIRGGTTPRERLNLENQKEAA